MAYGSNMSSDELRYRVKLVDNCYVGHVNGYGFRYNKKGKDGSSRGNMEKSFEEKTWGVCYEIDDLGFIDLRNLKRVIMLQI